MIEELQRAQAKAQSLGSQVVLELLIRVPQPGNSRAWFSSKPSRPAVACIIIRTIFVIFTQEIFTVEAIYYCSVVI